MSCARRARRRIFDLLAALDLELHIVPRSKMTPGELEDIF
jgi:HTH-type transcriptional regulator/antitoxin HipB